ncbi:MAG: hypothetical protein AB1635_04595 [Acidobacteriota bacterium]
MVTTRRMALVGLLAAGVSMGARAQDAGFFVTGQDADLLISGYGFNRTGGPLRFNHPAGVAVVEGHLVVADRNNNRVLIWDGIPASGAEAPSWALGQASFDTNAPGRGLDGLNWPTAVATDGTRLYVADTYNDRVLVWRSLPRRSKQPADFALTSASDVSWPWGIWTNGRQLAVSATSAGRVLLWTAIPEGDVRPDFTLKPVNFGTPRTVESDGTRVLVSDHNARHASAQAGTFFWTRVPTSTTQAPDFFVASPTAPGPGTPGPAPHGEHIHDAEALPDGRLLALFNRTLCIWNTFPRAAGDPCSVLIGSNVSGGGALDIDAGDNSGIAVSATRTFLSLNNGNRVLVWTGVPAASNAVPAFAIGSPDLTTNTLTSDGIIQNGVPQTDGQRLYVSSDFDRRLHVWRTLPTADGQKADVVYTLPFAPWASTRVGPGLALAGQSTVMYWATPPDGQPADVRLEQTIGGVEVDDLRGIAYDGRHFALASYSRNRVWVWDGPPSAAARPIAELPVEQPGRIASDGRYLAVTRGGPGGGVLLYELARIAGSAPSPVQVGAGLRMNLPQGVSLDGGGLFIADTNGNRVLAWMNATEAYNGRQPDAVLGATDLTPRTPAIGRDTLFWPGAVAYDGRHLWVAEFKFGNRIVRFSRP